MKNNKLKYGEKLLLLMEEKNYSFMPKYPFNKSFDEVLSDIYWYEDDKDVNEQLKKQVENYSKWCLDNFDIVEKMNQ